MSSKDFDFTTVGFDTMLKTEVLTSKIDEFATDAARLGLTVDRIAGIFLNANHGIVVAPYLTGTLDAKTKGKTLIVAPNLPALMSWTNVYGMYTFGVASDEKIDTVSWLRVLDQLKEIKDKRGRHSGEFYGVGYASKKTIQYMSLPDKSVIIVSPSNEIGISSLRYDFANARYYGVRLDEQGIGSAIISAPLDQIIKNPELFRNVPAWTNVADHIDPAVISLSRIKVVDGFTTFFANHVGGRCNSVIINQVADDFSAVWEKAVQTPIIMIGTVASTGNIYAAYRDADSDGLIEVFIENPKIDDFPFISLTI
jgi:hypothetical protein